MSNFWNSLQRPFFVLAPMADVTDAAFRRVIAKYGKPDVMWTEFVSADGLFLGGREHLLPDLQFTESERPIVAQFFTSRPEMMEKAAALARELNFDGVDINMGCPDRSIEKQGAGAALIKNPTLAREVIAAAKHGARSLPVSVKTRVGFNKEEIETWFPVLLESGIAALTVHARTRKEMSKVPARWEHVKRAVELRDEIAPQTLIIGNGDVVDIEEGKRRVAESGCDGVMIGRGIFGNPWLFSHSAPPGANTMIYHSALPILRERLRVMGEHTKLFEELLPHKNFVIMKKHYKAYVNGFDGAKELRMELMETRTAAEVEEIVERFFQH
jgi:nifR3 family TIM-barrel protein